MLPPPPLLLRAATARPGSIAAAIASTPVSQPVTADDDDADEEFSITTLAKPGTRHYVSKAQNAGTQDAKAVPVQSAARNPFNDDTAPTSFIPPVQRHQTPKAQYAGQATPQPAASQQAPATGKRRRLRQKKAQAEQAAQQNAPQAPAFWCTLRAPNRPSPLRSPRRSVATRRRRANHSPQQGRNGALTSGASKASRHTRDSPDQRGRSRCHGITHGAALPETWTQTGITALGTSRRPMSRQPYPRTLVVI